MTKPPKRAPKRAMVLAAGLGLRMMPITKTLPKPLVKVAGKPLIDWAIDRLEEAGVKLVVVNLHHLGPLVRSRLDQRRLEKPRGPEILYSVEPQLLETGGGAALALPMLGNRPFYVINSDALWLDGACPALFRLANAWNGRRMDGLLLLHPVANAHGYEGKGDFILDHSGTLARRPEKQKAPYLFTGTQILHPHLFKDAPKGPFSLNVLYDQAIANGRLHGLVHDGEWLHIGTRQGLAGAEQFLAESLAGIISSGIRGR